MTRATYVDEYGITHVATWAKKSTATKTKNIRRHASYNRDWFGGDHLICLINPSGDKTDGQHIQVHLPHVVALKASRNLQTWLNHNCKGWYARKGSADYPAFDSYEFHFELSADAITAKLFHG